jgi:hypothetical protein
VFNKRIFANVCDEPWINIEWQLVANITPLFSKCILFDIKEATVI